MLNSVSLLPSALLTKTSVKSLINNCAKVSTTRIASRNSTYDPEDAFKLELMLTKDERDVRDEVQYYCQKKLLPRVLKDDQIESFDKQLLREFGGIGVLGTRIKGYGCPGMSSVATGLVMREIESIDSGYRTAVSAHSSLSMHAIYAFGSEEQKEEFLPKLAQGELIGCFGLNEPHHGADPGSIQSSAVYNEDSKTYKLSGSKAWITNSPVADILIVWAKSSRHQNKVKAFIIERSKIKSGLTTPNFDGRLSLRTMVTGMILMDDVEVDESALLPNTEGLHAAMSCLENVRYDIGWGALGAAEFCFGMVHNYVLNRIQYNDPMAAGHIVQTTMADMVTEISLGLRACIHVGRLEDSDLATPEMISMVKRNSCTKALYIARKAREMLGGFGLPEEYHLVRHVMNLESVSIHEGTSDDHALQLGKAVAGLRAFS